MAGAVYNPLALMVPPLALQVTAVLLVPVTVAVNCWVPPLGSDAAGGEMETLTPVPAGAVTLTRLVAVLLLSAALVAVTV